VARRCRRWSGTRSSRPCCSPVLKARLSHLPPGCPTYRPAVPLKARMSHSKPGCPIGPDPTAPPPAPPKRLAQSDRPPARCTASHTARPPCLPPAQPRYSLWPSTVCCVLPIVPLSALGGRRLRWASRGGGRARARRRAVCSLRAARAAREYHEYLCRPDGLSGRGRCRLTRSAWRGTCTTRCTSSRRRTRGWCFGLTRAIPVRPSAAPSLSAKPPCTCPTVARILCCRTRSTLTRAQVREPT
jgi:hypothetical protein